MRVSSCINIDLAAQAELKRLVREVLSGATLDKSLLLPDQKKYPSLFDCAACFVTLYKHGALRGCIGTYHTDMALWFNVCRYAHCSAFEDRRFEPLNATELAQITFEISILSELSEQQNNGEQALLAALNVGSDGLLLKEGRRSAIFLPSVWQTLPTPTAFLQGLKHKGGWPSDYWHEQIAIYRFSTFVIAGDFASRGDLDHNFSPA